MDPRELLKAKDPDLFAGFVALQRAAKIARQIAIQTRTAIIIQRGTEVVRVSAEMLEKLEEEEKNRLD